MNANIRAKFDRAERFARDEENEYWNLWCFVSIDGQTWHEYGCVWGTDTERAVGFYTGAVSLDEWYSQPLFGDLGDVATVEQCDLASELDRACEAVCRDWTPPQVTA